MKMLNDTSVREDGSVAKADRGYPAGESGSFDTMDAAIKRHTPLVRRIAGRFGGAGLAYEDLVSEGKIGLMTAFEKFDPSKGTKFSTYAGYWITHRIRRSIDKHGSIIRIPCGTINMVKKLRRARSAMKGRLGREPIDSELAEELTLPQEKVRKLKKCDVSAYLIADSQDPNGLARRVQDYPDRRGSAPDEIVMLEDSEDFLRGFLRGLNSRELGILNLYFGMDGTDPLSFAGIGRRLGLSGERVRQIQKESLDKLKKQIHPFVEDFSPLWQE